jgi:hypothetical protein
VPIAMSEPVIKINAHCHRHVFNHSYRNVYIFEHMRMEVGTQ